MIVLGEHITFTIKHYHLRYVVEGTTGLYFLKKDSQTYNWEVFDRLKIINRYEFASNVYGYEAIKGGFPYARTLEDLNRLICKLQEMLKIYG